MIQMIQQLYGRTLSIADAGWFPTALGVSILLSVAAIWRTSGAILQPGEIRRSLYGLVGAAALGFLAIEFNGGLSDWRMQKLAVLAAAFVLAALTHRWVELPAKKIPALLVCKRWGIGAALVLSTAVACLVGDGFPMRVQETTQGDPFSWPRRLVSTPKCLDRYSMPGYSYCVSTVKEMSAPKVYVIGDSHSNSLYSGFDATKGSAVNLGAPGCLPLRGIVETVHGVEDSHCIKVMDAVYTALGRQPPADVLLVARWALYATGVGVAPNMQYGFKVRIRSRLLPSEKPSEVLYESLKTDVSWLLKRGHRVHIMLQAPELDFSPLHCGRYRPFQRILQSANRNCEAPMSLAIERRRSYESAIFRVADELSAQGTITVHDPESLLCSKESCHAMVDDLLLYRDDNHLGAYGGTLLVQRLFGNLVQPPEGPVAAALK